MKFFVFGNLNHKIFIFSILHIYHFFSFFLFSLSFTNKYQAMWTLYRFIMMLCMGGARGDGVANGGEVSSSGSSGDGDGASGGNSSARSEETSSGMRGSSLKSPSPSLKRQTSGGADTFLELNAATKLRNKLLNFLTSELELMIVAASDPVIVIARSGELQERYAKTMEIMTFLVGMADVTTLMIYFGTSERVSILLSLFLVPEPNIRRMTALLLRYVLPMAGPKVAHRAWRQVVATLEAADDTTNQLKRQLQYVHYQGDFMDLILSKITISLI